MMLVNRLRLMKPLKVFMFIDVDIGINETMLCYEGLNIFFCRDVTLKIIDLLGWILMHV